MLIMRKSRDELYRPGAGSSYSSLVFTGEMLTDHAYFECSE